MKTKEDTFPEPRTSTRLRNGTLLYNYKLALKFRDTSADPFTDSVYADIQAKRVVQSWATYKNHCTKYGIGPAQKKHRPGGLPL